MILYVLFYIYFHSYRHSIKPKCNQSHFGADDSGQPAHICFCTNRFAVGPETIVVAKFWPLFPSCWLPGLCELYARRMEVCKTEPSWLIHPKKFKLNWIHDEFVHAMYIFKLIIITLLAPSRQMRPTPFWRGDPQPSIELWIWLYNIISNAVYVVILCKPKYK